MRFGYLCRPEPSSSTHSSFDCILKHTRSNIYQIYDLIKSKDSLSLLLSVTLFEPSSGAPPIKKQ